jgi:hypothetical protein
MSMAASPRPRDGRAVALGRAAGVAKRRGHRVPWWQRYLPLGLRRWYGSQFEPIGNALGDWAVLLTLLLAALALVALYQFPRTRSVDVGVGNDGFYLEGAYPQEQGAGTQFRWLDGDAEIVVPAAPGNTTWTATLRFGGERPPGIPEPAVDILADGRLVAHFATIEAFRDYTFTFRRDPLPPANLTLTVKAPTFDAPGPDARKLGIALDSFSLVPHRVGEARPILPPPAYVAAVLLLLIVLVALLADVGAPRTATRGAAAVAALAIVAGHLAVPDITARYAMELLLVGVAIFVAVLILRPLLRRLCAAGGVALSLREERLLLGIFAFGAALHLAGVFYPGFQAHDIGFQMNRLDDVTHGRLLLSTLATEWGYRLAPYPPALYILVAPVALLTHSLMLPLQLFPPLIDATSALLLFYLLRRCGLREPAPLLAAFFYALVPPTSQLLWWGFFPNLFGQWATLALLTVAVAHYAELPRPKVFAALVACLILALLSHPGTFVLTLAIIPILALGLYLQSRLAGPGGDWRPALALLGATALAGVIVYGVYYWHYTDLIVYEVRVWLTGAPGGPTDPAPLNVPSYLWLRLSAFPFALYFVGTWVAAAYLLRAGRRRLAWLVLAIMGTATLFAVVHLASGVWVRYFAFTAPALAIGAAVCVAWLWERGRLWRGAAYVALTYATVAGAFFWFSITIGAARAPYP